MDVLAYMAEHGHEQLVVCSEPSVGLRAFIAIHDTSLGPAVGGTRIWPFETEEEAIMDVSAAVRGDDLQIGGRGPAHGRRQGAHHGRPENGQDRGPSCGRTAGTWTA